MTSYANDLSLLEAAPVLKSSTPVAMLLGTDRHIYEGTPDQEKRIGITPEQAGSLIRFLESKGVTARISVVQGAGTEAGHADDAYTAAGCSVVAERDLGSARFDLVHALKEPCAYEAGVNGPFIRIGALHTGGDPKGRHGQRELLKRRSACAIFDGSSVGYYSHTVYPDRFKVPIRGAMSVFAGRIAGGDVGEHARSRKSKGRVIVSGAGIVGSNAIDVLRASYGDVVTAVVVIEPDAAARATLSAVDTPGPPIRVLDGTSIPRSELKGAIGVIFGAATKKNQAPQVTTKEDVAQLVAGSILVDVAADEGCSIAPYQDTDDAQRDLQSLGYDYRCTKNLPHRKPREATEKHGEAILPYLGTILYAIARDGSPSAATRSFHAVSTPAEGKAPLTGLDALSVDLRNGMIFRCVDESETYAADILRIPLSQLLTELGPEYEGLKHDDKLVGFRPRRQ
jgi:alanine dehydrogenase